MTVKFHRQVDDSMIMQSALLHNDIPAYNLPTLDSVLPQENDNEHLILEEENMEVLENVLVHMIDKQDIALFKSKRDYAINKQKLSEYIRYAQLWQVLSVICLYAAFICDILLRVTLTAFFFKYQKTMQAMLTAFISINMKNSGIPVVKPNTITRMFPPSFTINLPEEEKVTEELKEIESIQVIVQVIMILVSIFISITVLYYCCKKCRHTRTLFKYCFPFLPVSRLLCTSRRTDLFVEVNNLEKGKTAWAHFTATGYYPTSIHLSRPIPKENVRIETHSCIFMRMIVD